MRKKIRQALKTVGGPYSHRNKLASLNNLLLILIAIGFILFNSLDSKCTSYMLSYSLHHYNSNLIEFPSCARRYCIFHWAGLEMGRKRHRTSLAQTTCLLYF